MSSTLDMLRGMSREWLETEFRRATMVMPRSDGYVTRRDNTDPRLCGIEKHSAVCRVLGQYPIEIFPDDIGVSTRLAMDGFWEMWITLAIAKHVAKGSYCIDVGANVGYYTVLLAAVMDCRVQAWEPQMRVCGALDRTLTMNGITDRVMILQAAAASEELNAAHLSHDQISYGCAKLSDEKSGEMVRVKRIDDEVKTAVDFIKIDTEGLEEEILQGMLGVIQLSPTLQICMEWTPSQYEAPRQLLDWLKARFLVHRIEGDGELTPITIEDEERLVALPAGIFDNIWLKRLP